MSVPQDSSQSINISGGQLSNVQLGGVGGRDVIVHQSQRNGDRTDTPPLTAPEVSDLLDQLKSILQASTLSDAEKVKVIRSLDTAKDEVQAENPDKAFATQNLQRATEVLKDAGETVEAGTGLWQKVKPLLEAVSPWLGVATSMFL